MSGISRTTPEVGGDQPPVKKMKTEEGEKWTAGVQEEGQEKVTGEEMGEEEWKGEEGEGEEMRGKEDEALYAHLGKLKEGDVGITEYISDHKGVSAVIKQRYSDFIVNEVSSSGQVVHLTNADLPVVKEEIEVEPSGPVDDVLTEEFLAQLKQVAAGINPDFTASTLAGDDKMRRLRIHRAIKAAFPNVETKTEEKDGEKMIIAMMKGKGKDNRRKREFDWPSSCQHLRFCRFTMYKENRTTMDVIHLIAKSLKVKESVFGYAGTKDKRAKTTQEVTAFKIHPKKLAGVNKFMRNIMLGNFSYSEKQLKLGDLGGNRFTVVLRNVIGEDKDIEACLTSLTEVGFINYYGLQRFGSLHSCTHDIGRALLKEDWEEAASLIIGGTSVEGIPHRQVWKETRDPQATVQLCRGRHYIERKVLYSLLKKPTDFFGAVQNLARNTRMLYPHSYQSLVWNTVASRRIKTFGLKPMVGDLVLPPGVPSTDTQDTEEPAAGSEDQETTPKKPFKPRVEPIVLDETMLSQYSIYDIVLPLPGFDVVYPDNEVHSWYKEMLESDGLDIENMRRKQKDYSLPGSYRPLIIRPTDVEWKIFRYDDVTASLSLSDVDCINGVEEPESLPEGQLKAVRLSFTLGLSAYATMALREVLKIDTSPAQQASMNVS